MRSPTPGHRQRMNGALPNGAIGSQIGAFGSQARTTLLEFYPRSSLYNTNGGYPVFVRRP